MKTLVPAFAAVALIASPALAQTSPPAEKQTTAKTTHVKTTTKEIHETNVPVRHHTKTHHKSHHRARCSCPPTHAKSHHVKTTKKTTTETTTKTPG